MDLRIPPLSDSDTLELLFSVTCHEHLKDDSLPYHLDVILNECRSCLQLLGLNDPRDVRRGFSVQEENNIYL